MLKALHDEQLVAGAVGAQKEASEAARKHNSVQVVKGLVEGFGASPVKDTCISSSEDIADKIDLAMEEFKKQTPEGVMAAIQILAEAFTSGVPAMISDCDDTKGELAEILSALQKFKTAQELVYHIGDDIMVNGIDIYGDINNAIRTHDHGQWYMCGKYIGQAINLTLIGPEENMEM